jgi:predicted lipoprotein with Yx(FWY)xxD motif
MIRAALLALPLALCAGCGGDDDERSSEPPTAPAPPPAKAPAAAPAKAGTKVVLLDSQFGEMLFDSGRQAIYLFDREGSTRPRCYGECAAAWPPVYANGKPRLGKGLDSELLGTTERRDGRKQITYGGHPLYYYAHEGPGQVLCHDIVEYGGSWLVVQRDGSPAPS